VVGSQTASLTPDLSFNHNLCCRRPNGSCKAILDIYTLRPFQRYKEHLNARCFDPCNCALSFWESWRTPKSHFRECEWRFPHTFLKVGLRQLVIDLRGGQGQDYILGRQLSRQGLFVSVEVLTLWVEERVCRVSACDG
jgi:hypothetical protein